jgi:hypothetical protein
MMHFEVKMNYANPQEHVHEAKHNNRAINEWVQAAYHRLPFSRLPRIMHDQDSCDWFCQEVEFLSFQAWNLQVLQPPNDFTSTQSWLLLLHNVSSRAHQILCCLMTNEMVTTGNGSDWLPKRVWSDLTGDTWWSSSQNPTVLKARAMITPRTNSKD